MLSDRIRPNCEAAPWVIEEIQQMEAERDALAARWTALEDWLSERGRIASLTHDDWPQAVLDTMADLTREEK